MMHSSNLTRIRILRLVILLYKLVPLHFRF